MGKRRVVQNATGTSDAMKQASAIEMAERWKTVREAVPDEFRTFVWTMRYSAYAPAPKTSGTAHRRGNDGSLVSSHRTDDSYLSRFSDSTDSSLYAGIASSNERRVACRCQ
jgi:hypothetical protein